MAGKGTKSVDRTLAQARQLARAGRLADARTLTRDLIARYPHNRRAKDTDAELESLARPPEIRGVLSRAAELYQNGRWAEALRTVHPIAERCREDSMVQRIYAGTLLKLQRLKGAAIPLQRLLEIDGTDSWALVNSAIVLTHHGNAKDAVSILKEVTEREPDNAKAFNNLGNSLRVLGRIEEALPNLERAIELDPHSAEAFNNYGVILSEMGDREGSHAAQSRAIELAPDYVSAHRNLSAVHRYRPGDPHLAQMLALLPTISPKRPERAMLQFALGKAHDDIGAVDDAFHHYAAGNRLRSKELAFSLADEVDTFRRLARTDPSAAPLDVPVGAARPIFIVGMPRSGTSLVEQILGAHPQVTPLGEMVHLRDTVLANWAEQLSDDLTPDTLDAIAEDYRDAVRAEAPGATVFTDKAPLNFRWIGIIRRAFPEAAIVNVFRRREATCWSIFKLYFSNTGHGYGYDLDDLGGMYRAYEALMDVWRERFPGDVLDFDYDALTNDPETHITQLLAHCRLPFHEACLRPHENARAVQTASALQVRRAIYTGSSAAWERYEAHLDPLKAALSEPKPVLLPAGTAPPGVSAAAREQPPLHQNR